MKILGIRAKALAKKNKKKKNNVFANVKHKVLVSSVVGLSIIGILLLVALLAKGTSIISGASIEQTPTPSIEATDTPTPSPLFPLDKLTLENYSWKGNYFSGYIKNNYDKNVTNVEIKVLISKSRKAWEVGDEFTITIEDPIWAGESVYFNKYLFQKENDPWYTTRIISGLYYYGDKPSSPTPTVYVDPDPIEPCTSKNSGDSIMVKRSECQNLYVDCPVNNTWKVLTKEECTKEQNAQMPTNNNQQQNNYPPCTVHYSLEIVQTYYDVSPETCKGWQDEANAGNTKTAQPTIDYAAQNQANIQLQSQCKMDVASYYQQQITSVRSNHTLGDSSKQNAITSLNNQANQAAQACESKYPTN